MSSRHGVIPVNLRPFLCVKTAKKWKCFEESDSTDGSLCVSQRCTDGSLILYGWSSWTSVHISNQSARTHVATFVVQYAWMLSEVGNTHSLRYFGTNLLNQDNVTCNPYRGGLIMNWKANISSFLKYCSHSQFWFTVCFIIVHVYAIWVV